MTRSKTLRLVPVPKRRDLIVSPDERLVFHDVRGEGTAILSRIIREGVVQSDPPGVELTLEDIYGK